MVWAFPARYVTALTVHDFMVVVHGVMEKRIISKRLWPRRTPDLV
jgi:hypothetical protein